MDIRGKKIAFLGDSITVGYGASSPDKVYWKLIEQKTGAVCRGFGINGTRIARQISPEPGATHDIKHFITRIDQIENNTDIIMILGGVNDFAHGDAPIGNMNDRADDTFYGACHLLYSELIKKFPQAEIIVITPLHCLNEANASEKSNNLLDYVNVIIEVAAEYSLPVIDLYRTSGIQPKIDIQREMFMPDGIHPNDQGNERIAKRITSFLYNL